MAHRTTFVPHTHTVKTYHGINGQPIAITTQTRAYWHTTRTDLHGNVYTVCRVYTGKPIATQMPNEFHSVDMPQRIECA